MEESAKAIKFSGVKFYPHKLKRAESGTVFLDLIMLILVILNIFLFVFYWIYLNPFFREYVATYAGPVHAILNPIYERFFVIDAVFLGVYLAELAFRWGLAIYRKTYHRWFFYPFIHWYDVLGCIPVGSFRFLRILRVFALGSRLQRLGVIDLSDTYVYTRYLKYRAMLVEEVSDKVVINVLQGIQGEIQKGLPITDRLIHEVIIPYKPILVQWLSRRLGQVTTRSYEVYKDDLQHYVYGKIERAVEQNKEIKQIGAIPVLGSKVSDMLEHAIQDIVFQVVNGLLQDMAGRDHSKFLDEISGVMLETVLHEEKKENEEDALDEILSRFALDLLEIIKERVAEQDWKILEAQEKAELQKEKEKAEEFAV